MNTITKTIIAATVALTLTACGGGGGGSSSSTPKPAAKTIEGKVIDGYIIGATVFLDLNFNGQLDAGEPSTVTDAYGSYSLGLSSDEAACADYVPTVTHVPVGAFDTDRPDSPILEAYDMVSPPTFALTTDDDLLHLTPLTTIVWNAVEEELYRGKLPVLSCKTILEGQALREQIMERLTEQEQRVALRYNLTVDTLYSDYVATGATEVHTLAQALVPGLQASYAETLDLEAANPNANWLFVEYFMDVAKGAVQAFDYSEAQWMRREYVASTPGNYYDVTNYVSSDLTEVGEVFEHITQRTTTNANYEYEETVYFDGESNNCSIQESFRDLTVIGQYGVTNGAGTGGITSYEDCADLDRVAYNVTQAITTRTVMNGSKDVYYTESNHWWYTEYAPEFPSLIGLSDDIDTLEPGWLYSKVSYVQTGFFNGMTYGETGFTRTWNEYEFEEQGEYYEGWQKVHMRDQDDNYTVTYYYDDGTQKKLCGTYPNLEDALTDCTNQ